MDIKRVGSQPSGRRGIPPGETHWYATASTTAMTHISNERNQACLTTETKEQ